jgi:P27 family predicted phage terminase small subunit
MRGRKPKPTHLHLVDRTRPDKNRAELKSTGPLGEPPADFEPDQRTAWDEIVGSLPDGLLTISDRLIVEVCVDQLVTYRRSRAIALRTGVIFKDKDNVVRRNPAVLVMQRQSELMGRLLSEIGLTPASRARLASSDGDKEKDTIEQRYLR